MNRVFSGIIAAAVVGLAPATASWAQIPGIHLSGEFDVFWVNCTDSNAERSQATDKNFHEQFSRAERQRSEPEGGPEPTCLSGGLIYTGSLQFRTADPASNTTIDQWLRSSGGSIEGSLPPLRLSSPPSATDPNTWTTTIFTFLPNFPVPPTDFLIVHDDGVELLEGRGDSVGPGDLTRLGGSPAPTAAKITIIRGHKGNRPALTYAAAYGDPSVLVVFADPRPAP
jgi:hypothetical protein